MPIIPHSERGKINSQRFTLFYGLWLVKCRTKNAWVKMKSGGRPYVLPNKVAPLPDAWFIHTVFPLFHSPTLLSPWTISLSLTINWRCLQLFLFRDVQEAPRVFVSVMSRNIHKEWWITTQATSKCWRNPVKGTRTSYARQPQLDRTTGLHTRSLAYSQWCVGRTRQEYRTGHHQCNLLSYTCALLKLTKSNNEWAKSVLRCMWSFRSNYKHEIHDTLA
jgi:hypothetical protein